MSKFYIKYIGRNTQWQGNQAITCTTWKKKPTTKTDPKTGLTSPVPGVPLIVMSGPYDEQTARHFIEMRERENGNSPSTWLIVPEAELAANMKDVTENNIRA